MPSPLHRLSVLTHHKCASTFLGLYLREFSVLNGLRMFQSHLGTARPRNEYDISFLTNALYHQIKNVIDGPIVHVVRNPLDIIVSAYYSHRSTHGLDRWPQLQSQRRILMNCSEEEGLFLTLTFLERGEFYPETPGPLHGLRSWYFDDGRIRTVRMEDLVKDIGFVFGEVLLDVFGEAINLPKPSDFTFERMSNGRRIGEIDEMSHYRSGKPGGWRDKLPKPVIAYVREHFRDFMERYYPDALA